MVKNLIYRRYFTLLHDVVSLPVVNYIEIKKSYKGNICKRCVIKKQRNSDQDFSVSLTIDQYPSSSACSPESLGSSMLSFILRYI